jgi:DNA-binding transcriptional MerR regulator
MPRQPLAENDDELTIDDLARLVDLPVRTIREYHTQRLLPSPQRKGRVGYYGAPHVERLELVVRLQRRGYSLAGIRDLLEAWDSGTELTTLLGVDRGPVAMDETPLRLSRTELTERLPGLSGAKFEQAEQMGLIRRDGASHVLVRSPALLDLVISGVQMGVELDEMIDLLTGLAVELDALGDTLAGQIVEHIWKPLSKGDHAAELPGLFARGRLLLLQGVASVLADRLAASLLERAGYIEGGDALSSAVERVRIGVIADSSGALTRRSR